MAGTWPGGAEDPLASSSADMTLVGQVELEDGGVRDVLLRARLNAETGGLRWVPAEGGAEDESTLAQLRLWFPPMLNDAWRTAVYERAIAAAVAEFRAAHGRGPVVLDVGTGTGLLAMLAARAGAQHVYACDSFASMARLAERVVAANALADRVTVLAASSADLTLDDLGGAPCDMVVSELLDSTLLGEGMVPSLRDARARLLAPGAVSVPRAARMLGQLVECPALAPLDLAASPLWAPLLKAAPRSGVPPGPTDLVPLHAAELEGLRALSDPFPVLALDLSGATPLPDGAATRKVPVRARAAGRVHAVLVWWELELAAGLAYSTAPEAEAAQGFQDHWSQCAWVVAPSFAVAAGELVLVTSLQDDTAVRFVVERADALADARPAHLGRGGEDAPHARDPESPWRRRRDEESRGEQSVLDSREGRAAWRDAELALRVAGDATWGRFFCDTERMLACADAGRLAALQRAVAALAARLGAAPGAEPLVLDVGDGGLAGVLAACGGLRVLSLQDKPYARTCLARWSQALGVDARLRVWAGADQGEPWDPAFGPVHAVVADAFYFQMSRLPLWGAINFWLLRTAVDPVLAPGVAVLPARARLCCALVSFHKLWASQRPVPVVAGFDHSAFEEQRWRGSGGSTEDCPVALWQHPHTLLTDPVTILEIDMTQPLDLAAAAARRPLLWRECAAPVRAEGVAHAVATWVDLVLSAEAAEAAEAAETLTGYPAAGRPHWCLQSVRWLREPAPVAPGAALALRAGFDGVDASVTWDFCLSS